MNRTIRMMMVALPLALGACGQDKPAEEKPVTTEKPPAPTEEVDEEDPLDPRVEKAVTIANAIAADPDSADTILESNDMDRDKFEALMYEIAKDPELSQLYAANREA